MICEECCQFKSSKVKCLCDGGEVGVKRIGLVKGCIVFVSSSRCKKECFKEYDCCEFHFNRGKDTDNGFIEKYFGSK